MYLLLDRTLGLSAPCSRCKLKAATSYFSGHPGPFPIPSHSSQVPDLLRKARVSWFKLETGVQRREMTYDAHGRVAKARAFTVNTLTLSLVAPLKCQI